MEDSNYVYIILKKEDPSADFADKNNLSYKIFTSPTEIPTIPDNQEYIPIIKYNSTKATSKKFTISTLTKSTFITNLSDNIKKLNINLAMKS
jgi:hypothetical protein